MKKPHKHAALIKAWADGAEIETYVNGTWYEVSERPTWEGEMYRIRPELKPDVVAVGIIELLNTFNPLRDSLAAYKTGFRVSEHWEKDNVRITFDGETGKLKRVEVL